jgi:dienelactone hydrolase
MLALLLFVLAVPTTLDYDEKRPLDVQPGTSQTRGNALVQEISYASAREGRVPALLVTPKSAPPHPAAILFMHWGLGTRHSFLDEAVTLANSGVTSLLIDAPWNRPDPPKQSEREQLIQTVTDLRRGIDFLQSRSVVKHSFGFVGLSFGAWAGAVLSGVDPRVGAFVLAGGLASNSAADLDAEKWVTKASAPVFLQFAVRDEFITREQAARYDRATPQPHLMKWYEGGHEFNGAARRDRMSWLSTIFGFTLPDATYQPVGLPERPLDSFGPVKEIAKAGVVIEIPGMQHVTVRRDVQWAEGLRFDVYYPLGLTPKDRIPAIILLGGQGPPPFMRVMRSMRFSTTLGRALTARCNRIVIVPDITVGVPDTDALFRYIREHADELQVDRDSFGIVFRSAGWSYGFRAAYRNAPPYVKVAAAQYVMLSSDEPEWDPATVIKQGKTPLVLVTAQHDFFYDAAKTKRFLDAAKAAGVEVKHIHLPNGHHGFDIVDDLEESRDALLQTMLFLRDKLPVRR